MDTSSPKHSNLPPASDAMETDNGGELSSASAAAASSSSNKINQIIQPKAMGYMLESSGVNTSTLHVSLHPLVIMNVSEHWTRTRSQCESPEDIVILGAFIGKQTGRNIEVMNSFELKYDVVESKIVLDSDFYKMKESQFKQVFPDLDFLGWYTNGNLPNETDMSIQHQVMVHIHESPLLLKLDIMKKSQGLPINMYESIIDVVNGETTMLFVDLPYTLVTEEAERIGLDHMARVSSTAHSADSCSVVAENLRVQHNAVQMLCNRVRFILEFITATSQGSLPPNQAILREVFNLCHNLPGVTFDSFNEDFYTQCNDVALLSYLGALTKCANTISQYVNKFNVLVERQVIGRRRGW